MEDILYGSGSILVLDDDYCIIEVLSQMLAEIGYTCLKAMDCEKALEVIEAEKSSGNQVDCIIVDLSVEYCKDGRRIVDVLQESSPEILSIVSSGSPRHPAMLDHKSHGYTAILKKPYTIEDLGRVLHELLASKTSQ
jgi:CheY-like chemotaxis protein